MIDFETLALRRAKELSQSEQEWMEALKQPSFDEFSTYLTDGEVEAFIFSFDSAVPLTVVSGLFLKAHREGAESPYYDFAEMVNGSSLNLSLGLDFMYQLDLWEKKQQRALCFKSKMDAFRNYLADHSRDQENLDFKRWVVD